eukprot:TCONS_00022942-protein
MSSPKNDQGLPFYSKLMFYGMNGFFLEIVFTAIWYFVDPAYNHGWKLHGSTSLWSFPIYGISIYVLEKISDTIKPHVLLPFRAVIYIMWTYLWEYSTGYILQKFDACPWDYKDYTTYHLHGLITFDYAPLWLLAVVLCEKVTIDIAQNLSYNTSSEKAKAK